MAREVCGDDELDYLRSRTVFEAGSGLELDESYRLAHLPLVAPDHPKVVRSEPGKFYEAGRHPSVFSLALPIPDDALSAATPYRELDAELRASLIGPKIAWDIVERRRRKVHATICGSLAMDTSPVIDRDARERLAQLGRITVELRGLFSGNVNRGRLYLRAYPERRDDLNLFHAVQRALGRPLTNLYVVGIWNLVDDLDANEAAALAALLERWWDRPLLRFEADRLWLLGARDDLVLDSTITETIALVEDEAVAAQSTRIESTRSG